MAHCFGHIFTLLFSVITIIIIFIILLSNLFKSDDVFYYLIKGEIKKMNGKTTKYYKYKHSGSGTITIPISIAEALNWKHKDEVNLVIKNIDGKIGLFMYKKEK